jgi:hypothetical protein
MRMWPHSHHWRVLYAAACTGIKWKLSPKEDLLLEALDLLAGLDSHAKQQQSQLIKAVMSTAEAEAAEQQQQQQQQQQQGRQQ